MVTPTQKKGSRLAVSGLLLLFISLVSFLLTLIVFYGARHKGVSVLTNVGRVRVA
jgi:hypothetical protein